ncbi:superoxide dismutase family protein [Alteribacter aurantiacus]|uniref:superoxide dismutase family protein n=1 Tax=Alteribacter aurantiacus TaxID=254410 RepID=UPI000409A876|nr:superoxide dismutase family protein [Alteribacter aurantiacus]
MKINGAIFILSVLSFVVLSGCGGDNDQTSDVDHKPNNGHGVMDHGISKTDADVVETFSSGNHKGELKAQAVMENTDGENVGSVSFYSTENAVMVKANVESFSSGFHGFHIHENGICEADAEEGAFMSAGGHYNPGSHSHDRHSGDMPSIFVTENGKGYLVSKLDRFTPEQLIEDDVAVIIHEDPDNFAHIPDRYQSSKQDTPGPDEQTLKTGDAGDRAACGVVVKVEQ